MVKRAMHFTALLFLGACLFCTAMAACIPAKLPTSEKGRTGMPTSIYDPGTPPEPWDKDPAELPVYPDATRYESRFTFITEDDVADVIAYYKENLPDAEIKEAKTADSATTFITDEFILEVKQEGRNTVILFSRPKE
jgi:hypothetical protein